MNHGFEDQELVQIRFSGHADKAGLYAHISEVPNGHEFHPDGKSVTLTKNAVLNLDTFFSSFYESYWLAYTTVTEIYLSLKTSGPARVTLYRQSVEHALHTISDEIYTGSRDIQYIKIGTVDREEAGRLFACITALADGVVLREMAWSTSALPQHTIALAVVICTYNRETDLINIISKLAPLSLKKDIREIFVINNGSAGLSERLHMALTPLIQNINVTVCDQTNLGGSGGFTRGLTEVIRRGTSSHILLLDDDIDLDTDILCRLIPILEYGRDDMAVGGYMLDRRKPSWLHNHVTMLDADQLKVVAPLANCDLGNSSHLESLTQAKEADFCGWWCCALPRAALTKTGMPLPFFLHYDDAEFGLRLQREGKNINVSWPGLAVWHEPFYVKAAGWRRYYDYRNVLFLLRYHNRLSRCAVLRQFALRFAINIIQFHYDSAWATLQAMADYLKGPSLLATWDGATHQKLLDRTQKWVEPPLPVTTILHPAIKLGMPPRQEALGMVLRILSDVFRPIDKKGEPKVIMPEHWSIWVTEGYDAVAVPDNIRGLNRVYRRNPGKVLRLLWRFIGLCIAFICVWDYRWSRAALYPFTRLNYWQSRWEE